MNDQKTDEHNRLEMEILKIAQDVKNKDKNINDKNISYQVIMNLSFMDVMQLADASCNLILLQHHVVKELKPNGHE